MFEIHLVNTPIIIGMPSRMCHETLCIKLIGLSEISVRGTDGQGINLCKHSENPHHIIIEFSTTAAHFLHLDSILETLAVRSGDTY